MAYTLYPRGSVGKDPNDFSLSYEWGDSFDNHEWRPCVEHFLGEIAQLGYEVNALSVPPFTPTEDFIAMEFLVGGIKTTFISDHLLSLINIYPEEPSVLCAAWATIGNKVGWEHVAPQRAARPGLWRRIFGSWR